MRFCLIALFVVAALSPAVSQENEHSVTIVDSGLVLVKADANYESRHIQMSSKRARYLLICPAAADDCTTPLADASYDLLRMKGTPRNCDYVFLRPEDSEKISGTYCLRSVESNPH
jgi:hypothetical protein